MKLKAVILIEAILSVMGTVSLCQGELDHGAGGMMIGTIPEKVIEGDSGVVTNAARTVLLPLKQTDIQVEMIPGIISADVRQLFFNDSCEYIEANYVFPLPEDATISEMIITINDDRVVRSVVKEREEARKTYEEAKKAGKRTALLNRNAGNMMNMKIANLAPGDSAEVHLVYFQSTCYDNGSYRLTVPTVVAKQYVPAEIWNNPESIDPVKLESIVENGSAPRLPPGVSSDHHFSFSMNFSGIKVKRVSSPSHELIVSFSQDELDADISLAGSVSYPDRDVVIDIAVEEPETLSAGFLSSKLNDEYFTSASVVPVFDSEPVVDVGRREVVFIVDTSGSMSGVPLSQAKNGIVRALKYLRMDDRFSIYEFNNDYTSLISYAPASRENIDFAESAVNKLNSEGGTEFLPVIEHILNQKPVAGEQRLVIFLTDGQSCQEDEVLKRLMTDNTGTKFFPVSIGSSPNMSLLNKMAELGRGSVTSIYNQKGIAEAVEMLFARLQKPVMTDIEVKLVDAYGREVESEIYPSVFPDVFAGLPVKCSINHKELDGVRMLLSGVSNGRRTEMNWPIPERVLQSDAIAQMFGQALIGDLNSQMLVAETQPERDMIKETILQTALDFQLVCKYTSRVAVEELIEKLPDGELRYVPVPLHTPHGVLECTATDDAARIIAGVALLLIASGLLVLAKFLKITGRMQEVGRYATAFPVTDSIHSIKLNYSTEIYDKNK